MEKKEILSLEILYEYKEELDTLLEDEDFHQLDTYFPDSHVETIHGAGHWVHAEAPELFMNAVLEFLVR